MTISQILNHMSKHKGNVLNFGTIRNKYPSKKSLTITSVTTDMDVAEFEDLVDELKKNLAHDIDTTLDNKDAYLDIKLRIHAFNVEHGQLERQAKINTLNDKLNFVRQLYSHYASTDYDNDSRHAMSLVQHQSMLSDTVRHVTKTVNVCSKGDPLDQYLKETIAQYERGIQQLSDEMAKINQTHTMDVDLSFLTSTI